MSRETDYSAAADPSWNVTATTFLILLLANEFICNIIFIPLPLFFLCKSASEHLFQLSEELASAFWNWQEHFIHIKHIEAASAGAKLFLFKVDRIKACKLPLCCESCEFSSALS